MLLSLMNLLKIALGKVISNCPGRFLTFNEPRLSIGNTNGFGKIEDSLITELPYDEIIKKENWDAKWSCIFKKNRVESLRPS